MAAPIQNPAKCEVRSVIPFLHGKGQRPADIHKEIVSVYGNIMNRQNVTKWCHHFSEENGGKQFMHLVIILVENHSMTMMRSKMLKCGSDNRRQPSMTVGYKSLCTDLTNVWITGVIMPKNNK
ncbi:uncharacterized protein TNCV_843861 [Trichonephila clavipes]|nr:uncharacterized protein TNCV_843861 [Trichonephila clavipes]